VFVGGITKENGRRRFAYLKNGGDEGDRTPDLCNAIAALSQLSYVPVANAEFRMKNARCELRIYRIRF
jgi:hypothetical protein